MADVPRTSLECPIIWSPGCPASGSSRRPLDVPVQNFSIFALPVKIRKRQVIQGLLLLKINFSLNHQLLCWSHKNLLSVPCRCRTFGPLKDLQWTSPAMSRTGCVIPFLMLVTRNKSVSFYWAMINLMIKIVKKRQSRQ